MRCRLRSRNRCAPGESAAFIISPLLKTHGWRLVFELGAGATVAMIPVVWFCVPESVSWLCRKQPANALTRINAALRRMLELDPPAERAS